MGAVIKEKSEKKGIKREKIIGIKLEINKPYTSFKDGGAAETIRIPFKKSLFDRLTPLYSCSEWRINNPCNNACN